MPPANIRVGVGASRRRARHDRRMRIALFWELIVIGIVLLVIWRTPLGYVLAALLAIIGMLVGISFNRLTVLQRIQRRLRFRRRQSRHAAAVASPSALPPDLLPLGEWVPGLTVKQTRSARGDDVGVITDGTSWTALLGLVSDEDLIGETHDEIDLDALAGLTVQDDIVFAAVQVITYTVPAPATLMLLPNSPLVASYRQISGDLAPAAVRRTWIGVRLDPRLCLEAIAARGASDEGIFATLRFGLHRVQTALKRQGIRTRELTALEIYDVLAMTSGAISDALGTEPGEARTAETWTDWRCDDFHHYGQRISRWGDSVSEGYQKVLDLLDSEPILFGVTSFTLDSSSRSAGGVRVVAPSEEQAAGVMERVREETDGVITFAPSGGDQVPAMIGTVPLGREVER